MSDSGALAAQLARGPDLFGMANQLVNLRTNQFNLQQAQLQPTYAALGAALENPNLTMGDLFRAVGESTRLGADPSGMIQNIQEMAAQVDPNTGKPRYSPRDIALQLGTLRYVPPFEQAGLVLPQLASRAYGQGVHQGLLYGPATGTPGRFDALDGSSGAGGSGAGAPVAPSAGGAGGGGGGVPTPSGSDSGAPSGPGQQAAGIPGLPGSPSGPAVGPHGPMGTPAQMRAQMAVNAETGQPLFSGFYGSLSAAESNNRNILSAVDPGSPTERSQGYFQINTPTAMQFAARAGIDPRLVEGGVMRLTPAEQQALVSQIPFGRFGPRTQRMLESQYGPINPNMTIGQLAARFDQGGGGGGGAAGAPFQVASAGNTFPVPTGGASVARASAEEPPTGSPYFTPFGMAEGAAEAQKITQRGGATRAQALQDQMQAAWNTRATLEGMEADLNNMPASGVTAGPLGTLKNAIVSSGIATQQTVDDMSKGLAAQEQFEKFSSMLNQQLLAGMGGHATDARQELTGASTPSSIHSKLGNLGIIHMLEGNISAMQIMGRSWRAALDSGQWQPGQFDAWRDQFTAAQAGGARFDPRVMWISKMGPQEQQSYINSLTPRDRAQLHRNATYAEQQGWVYENPDHTMGTGY